MAISGELYCSGFQKDWRLRLDLLEMSWRTRHCGYTQPMDRSHFAHPRGSFVGSKSGTIWHLAVLHISHSTTLIWLTRVDSFLWFVIRIIIYEAMKIRILAVWTKPLLGWKCLEKQHFTLKVTKKCQFHLLVMRKINVLKTGGGIKKDQYGNHDGIHLTLFLRECDLDLCNNQILPCKCI